MIIWGSAGQADQVAKPVDATAAEDELPSRMTLEGGSSSTDSRSGSLDADIGLTNHGRALFGASASRFNSSVGELQTNTIRLGYQTDPLEEWNFSAEFENWGAKDKLTTNSLRGSVVWSPEYWELAVDPEVKSINWSVPQQSGRKLRATGSALHTRASYYGITKLTFGISASVYAYSDRMETILASGYFYDEALDLAAGFPKSSLGTSASYRVDPCTFGLGYTVTRYQFTDEEARTTTARLSADIGKSWGASFEVGASQSGGGKSNFNSLAVSYQW